MDKTPMVGMSSMIPWIAHGGPSQKESKRAVQEE